MRKIVSVSEIRTAENGNPFVVASSELTITSTEVIPSKNVAIFGDEESLKGVKAGLLYPFEA